MNKIYNFVDEIYCINLVSRLDRYQIMKQFEKNENIKLTFYRPEKDPRGGRIGCFISHINVIKMAYDKGHKNILIFEDDIIITPSYNTVDYDEIVEFIKTNKWDILNLSPCFLDINVFYNHNEYKNIASGPAFFGSSYILNRKSMKDILDNYHKYIQDYQIDSFYNKYLSKKYYNVIPGIFDQDMSLGHDNLWKTPLLDQLAISLMINTNIIYNLSLIKYYNKYLQIFTIFLFLLLFLYRFNKKLFFV